MSTENEAAATPAAEPTPAPAPGSAPGPEAAPVPGPADGGAHASAEDARTTALRSADLTKQAPAASASDGTGQPPSSTPPPPSSPPPGQFGPAGGGGPYAGGHGGPGPGGPTGPGGPGGPGGPYDPWAAPSGPGPEPRRKGKGGLVAAAVAVALIAGGVGGGVGFWAAGRDDSSTTISSNTDPEALNRSPKSVAGIAAKALPSVVTIKTDGGGEEGTGTGFVYDKQGHILTNNHVVAGAADGGGRVTATFSDGKKYDAEVIGNAQGYDIAVIKLRGADDRKLEPLPLGQSDKVAVGDATIAIGAPFGLSGTVTTGIVSAENRPVASSDGQGSQASYMNALQTDASINPGNSGGPLLNAQGAVIGVNSAIQSGGGGGMGGEAQSGSVGLGFAIPVNQAKRVAEQLLKTGEPVYPVIGATVGLDEGGGGARITQRAQDGGDAIPKGSPADKAGLKPGDVITKLDNTVVDSGPTLIGTIWTHEPGEKVKITYERDGKEHTTDVTLGSKRGDS